MSTRSRFRLPGHFHTGTARCAKCGAPAVWHYSPVDSGRKREWREVFCDKCVPRGCSCNIHFTTRLPYRDKLGRLQPCVEYTYHGDGLLIDKAGKIAYPPNGLRGYFIHARLPHHGHVLRWPPGWYLSGRGRTLS